MINKNRRKSKVNPFSLYSPHIYSSLSSSSLISPPYLVVHLTCCNTLLYAIICKVEEFSVCPLWSCFSTPSSYLLFQTIISQQQIRQYFLPFFPFLSSPFPSSLSSILLNYHTHPLVTVIRSIKCNYMFLPFPLSPFCVCFTPHFLFFMIPLVSFSPNSQSILPITQHHMWSGTIMCC